MTEHRIARAKELLWQALDQPSDRRAAFLDERCTEPELRAEVESLLEHHDEAAGGVLSNVPLRRHGRGAGGVFPDPSAAGRHRAVSAPEKIGSYTLGRVIASGGMGTVYVAVQEQPRREVALKLMNDGVASPSALRRFEFEAQILGRLHHPNVAQVYEAGTHDEGAGGVPYFVMEYVPNGKPITEYTEANGLGTRERLDLFAKVCDAVHHGHQKGIIHRDLKPSNILVDGSGQPKIIDFGVARATDSDLAVTTLQTELGQLIGTLQYMSPEQCEANPDDLDTRTDVYALGVVLYELLTQELPYNVSGMPVQEVVCVIREQTPACPGTINRTLRGDLDTITLKALEKDRERRYNSAEALADDVRHYLRNEPIEARPPSVSYQLTRFAHRHRPIVVGAAAVLLVMIAGIVTTNLALLRALTAEKAATRQAGEFEQVAEFQAQQLSGIDAQQMGAWLKRDLVTDTQIAWEQLGLKEAEVEERVSSLKAALAKTNFTDLALHTLRKNIFETALKAVDEQFREQPLMQARLLHTLAETLREVGLLEAARAPLDQALESRRRLLGDDDPKTLRSINEMSALLLAQRKLTEAEPYCQEALEGCRRALGDDHRQTLRSLTNMAELLHGQGKIAEAEPYFREALAGARHLFGDDHPDTLGAINDMGCLLVFQHEFTEAEQYLREALSGYRRVHGDEHPETLTALSNLGYMFMTQRRFAESEPYLREALEGNRRVLGDGHHHTLMSFNNLCFVLQAQDRLGEAEPYLREAVKGRRRLLGDEHPATLIAIANLGNVLLAKGELGEAEPYLREAVESSRRVHGGDDREMLMSIVNLGGLLEAQGKFEEAAQHFLEALEGFRRLLGDDHPDTLRAINEMGGLFNAQGRYADAEEILSESVDAGGNVPGQDHWRASETRSLLGESLAGQGRFAEAEQLLLEGHAGFRASLPAGHRRRRLPPAIERLVRLYESWDKPDKVAEWRARLEALEANDE